MLNKWFHGALGFHNGVRASASMTFGLLVISLLLMRPQYPKNAKKAPNTLRSFGMFLTEFPYVVMVLGYVLFLQFTLVRPAARRLLINLLPFQNGGYSRRVVLSNLLPTTELHQNWH